MGRPLRVLCPTMLLARRLVYADALYYATPWSEAPGAKQAVLIA
jgi:hypothetical protein